MGQVLGANPQELRNLCTQMRADADRLEQIRNDLGSRIGRTSWDGPDAEEIRANWTFRWSGQLGGAVAAMQSAANVLIRNAEQQEQASGTDGGSPSLLSRLYDVNDDLTPYMKGIGAVLLGVNTLKVGEKFVANSKWHAFDAAKTFIAGDSGIAKEVRSAWAKSGKIADTPFVRTVIGHDVKFADDAKFLAKAGEVAKAAGVFAYAGVAMDGLAMVRDPSLPHVAGVVLDVAQIASVGCPPLMVTLGVAQLAIDHPKAVETAAKVVGSAVKDVAVAELTVTEDVGHAAASIASGGIKAIGHALHW